MHAPAHAPSLRAAAQGATSRSCARRDVTGDGDPKLLVADQNRKLRLYKGINLVSEHALVRTRFRVTV